MKRLIFLFLIITGFSAISQIIPTEGLVAHWNFDNNAIDHSGNGKSGTIVNAVYQNDRFGNAESALRLSAGKYMDFSGITLTNATYSFWIRPEQYPNPDNSSIEQRTLNIIGHSSTTNHKRIFINANHSVSIERNENNVTAGFSTPTLELLDWQHIIVVVEGTEVDLYVDGVLTSRTYSVDPGDLSFNRLGTSSSTRRFQGRIDDVLIYNRALSKSEISLLMDPQTWHKNGDFAYFNGGNVGIGTKTPLAKLSVKGDIRATKVEVLADISTVPDYVFSDDYKLSSLEETEQYIEKNHHLPEVPSAEEISIEGLDLGEMNLLLLKKIEELTLHTIRQQKEINELKHQLKDQEPD